MTFSGSGIGKANGKLFLFGEHAVVYGYPCIVAAVDKGISSVSGFNGSGKDEFVSPGVKDMVFVHTAVEFFRKTYGHNEKLKIEISGNLGNFGLGTSSAVVVAVIKSLGDLYKIDMDNKRIFDLSFKSVIAVQKKGSGADVACAVYGNTVYFEGKTKYAEKISTSKLPLIVGFSGGKAKTVDMITGIENKFSADPENYKKIFREIGRIAELIKGKIINNDWMSVGRMMSKNHIKLKKLGVSTKKLDQMVRAAVGAGAYGAKLSGAGGGDCMIACVSREKRGKVGKAIERAGGVILNVDVG